MPRLLGFTQSAYDPAARFRFMQFMPRLAAAGWAVSHRPNRPDRQWRSRWRTRWLAGVHYRAGRGLMRWNRWLDLLDTGRFDVVFTNRDLAGPGLFFEKRLLRRNPRFIYDFDDALFVGPNADAVAWMCAHAAWVTPGNKYLAEFARQYTDRVTVMPTVVDTDTYEPRQGNGDGNSHGRRVRVGWSGSDQSLGSTLLPRMNMLAQLQRKVDFELVVVSNRYPELFAAGLRWSFQPWRPEDEGRLGRSFEIGIMPLEDDKFQRGKCGLKLLQYMAAGLPTVASPVGVNDDIVVEGITGLKARTDADWHQALARLIREPYLRMQMGRAGRQRCEQEYSVRRWLPVLLGLFERVRTHGETGTDTMLPFSQQEKRAVA